MKKFLIPIGVLWVVVSFVIGVMIMLLPSGGNVNRVQQVKVSPRPKSAIAPNEPLIQPLVTAAVAKVTIAGTKPSSTTQSKNNVNK